MEVWYPASDSVAGEPGEDADFAQFIPQSVIDVLGPIEFPPVPTGAVRDAPLRSPEEPYPVVVFSHGFGGMRLQSVDYTVHLASRGYVVVAADHPGRMLTDLLPCMFSPFLEGCDLSGMGGADPAVEDVAAVADWVEAAAVNGPFAGAIDPARMGLSGHSAGGGTVDEVADLDPRFSVFLSMAAGAAPATDAPVLLMDGTCDGIIPDAAVVDAWESRTASTLIQIQGAGHLAFADLCELDLLTLGETLLAPRDDVNQTFLDQLFALASDGCANGTPVVDECEETGFLPLSTSDPIVRAYTTVWFDQHLRSTGTGVRAGLFPEAVVTLPE
jgi:predicted dienelactone hydrolase